MPIFIEMPKLSDTMTEGKLLKWHVKEGDDVSPGDVVADVETDKATMEMEAFDEGTVGKIYVSEDSSVPVGSALIALVDPGEEAPDQPPPPRGQETQPEPAVSAAPAAEAQPAPEQAIAPASTVPTTPSGRIKASPVARKVAAQLGIDLAQISGTGPGGRIVKEDVENAAASPQTATPQSATPAPAATPQPLAAVTAGAIAAGPAEIRPAMGFDPGAERIELTGMRRVIAERLSAANAHIPHFYLNAALDAGPLMAMRKQVNEGAEAGGNKFTVNDFILKAAVLAAADVPQVNAAWNGDSVVQYNTINLAVAIAIPDGLVTPVIRDAQSKTMLQISQEVKDLASRAGSKKLSPDEFQDGTFTVSNLGAYGIDSFDAVINPPQAIILAVGSIKKVPVADESGGLGVGLRMWVGMSCDHRVVDGAVGATYLQALRKYIENPALMLV